MRIVQQYEAGPSWCWAMPGCCMHFHFFPLRTAKMRHCRCAAFDDGHQQAKQARCAKQDNELDPPSSICVGLKLSLQRVAPARHVRLDDLFLFFLFRFFLLQQCRTHQNQFVGHPARERQPFVSSGNRAGTMAARSRACGFPHIVCLSGSSFSFYFNFSKLPVQKRR